MSLPPYIVDVRVAHQGGRRRRLWLPVVVLWPLLALLGLLALAGAVLVDAVLLATGYGQGRWTALVAAAFAAVAEARGLRISVDGPRTTVDVVVK